MFVWTFIILIITLSYTYYFLSHFSYWNIGNFKYLFYWLLGVTVAIPLSLATKLLFRDGVQKEYFKNIVNLWLFFFIFSTIISISKLGPLLISLAYSSV
jgi:hypothetical protein